MRVLKGEMQRQQLHALSLTINTFRVDVKVGQAVCLGWEHTSFRLRGHNDESLAATRYYQLQQCLGIQFSSTISYGKAFFFTCPFFFACLPPGMLKANRDVGVQAAEYWMHELSQRPWAKFAVV